MLRVELTVQCVGDEDLGHHVLETGHHDVEEVELVDHAERQSLVAEQLYGHVNHAVTERVRVCRLLQHHRYPTVVQHKRLRQRLLQQT